MEALSTRIELHTSIAHLHWTLDALDEAMAHFEAGLALAADHPLPGEKASLFNGTGIILYERNQLDAALERFESGLQFRSSSRALLINLGATQCVLGRIQEALDLGQKAIRASPADADTWSRLAYIYNAAGRPDDAIRCLTKASELAPRAHAHHAALAVIYTTMDRSEDAHRHLAMARPEGGARDSQYLEVLAAAVMGDPTKALAALKSAVQAGGISPASVRRDINLNLLFGVEDLGRATAANGIGG
jgi:tetratricopeptide (TPR) repeat protein